MIGDANPGIAELAATASRSDPRVSRTSSPVALSVATTTNGLGSASMAVSGRKNATRSSSCSRLSARPGQRPRGGG